MIRYAATKDIPALKALWKQAFADEDDFIERFFAQRVCHSLQNGILLEVGGQVVSMLYALPCTLQQGSSGSAYPAVNLVGVATEHTQRKKGYMRTLLEAAFELLQGQGIEAAVLKPSNPQFYEKFGFHICNTLYQLPLSREQFQSPAISMEELPAFLTERQLQMKTEQYRILKSEEDWRFQLEDGACISLWKEGYAVCEPEKDGFLCFEAVPVIKGAPSGYTMYKKIGRCPALPEDIGRENLIFEWY